MSPVTPTGMLRAILRRRRWLFVSLVAVAGTATAILWSPPPRAIEFPDGKRFALTIVDDTDLTTLERIKPIYDALHDAGLRTTKTVWSLPMAEDGIDADRGDTLQDPHYRNFILDLKAKGFEIALHGVRGGSSPRETSIKGLEEFKSIVGVDAKAFINHAVNREDLVLGTASTHDHAVPMGARRCAPGAFLRSRPRLTLLLG